MEEPLQNAENQAPPTQKVMPTIPDAPVIPTPKPPPQIPKEPVDRISVDEQIRKLEEQSSGRNPIKDTELDIDRYRDASKRLTFYYKNKSGWGITLGSRGDNIKQKFGLWMPGESRNLLHYWDEEYILNSKDIRNLEFPLQGDVCIQRLTPEEYLNEFRSQQNLERKIRQTQLEKADSTRKPDQSDKISEKVKDEVNQLLTYEARDEQGKKSSAYTKYHFIKWLRGYIFNAEEYRHMAAQVKDNEILDELLKRKSALGI
jgi:hypothetical protein